MLNHIYTSYPLLYSLVASHEKYYFLISNST